ncbi:MAG: transporter [Ginsengibacter sp.]
MLRQKLNPRAKSEINSGFGANSSNYGGRFLDSRGLPNVKKTGIGFFQRISWYHFLLQLSSGKFFLIVISFYLVVNMVFGSIFYLIGTQVFGAIETYSQVLDYWEAFFFSCQVFSVGGYGLVSPENMFVNSLCAIEAFLGLLSLAVVTGLLYGRFSRPKAYLKFSNNALLSPYHGNKAIMFRVAPIKNTSLTNAEVIVTLGIITEEDGKMVNKFYQLPLEYESVGSLSLNWTVVHPVTESSPFYVFSKEDYRNIKGEIIIVLKAFDDMFSNTVISRKSYSLDEVVVGAKFLPMYKRALGGERTILYLDKINSYEEV